MKLNDAYQALTDDPFYASLVRVTSANGYDTAEALEQYLVNDLRRVLLSVEITELFNSQFGPEFTQDEVQEVLADLYHAVHYARNNN